MKSICPLAYKKQTLKGGSLASIALYLISGQNWKDARLQVNCEDNEVFLQFTVGLGDAFATWGNRRDPWSQKRGSEYGIGNLITDGGSIHHGKMHLVTCRGFGVVVRELNLMQIVNFANQSIQYSGLSSWFNASGRTFGWRALKDWWSSYVRNKVSEAVIIPIPTCVGVTPWSYDEITWHDFVADTHNWMVYAGSEWAYKSMSYKLGSVFCTRMINRSRYLARFSPVLKKLDQPLSNPIFITDEVFGRTPHKRICRIGDLRAY